MATCTLHRNTDADFRCDGCGRWFCRSCVEHRFISGRSTEWLCPSCRGVGRRALSGLIRAKPDYREPIAWGILRSGLVLIGIVVALLYTANALAQPATQTRWDHLVASFASAQGAPRNAVGTPEVPASGLRLEGAHLVRDGGMAYALGDLVNGTMLPVKTAMVTASFRTVDGQLVDTQSAVLLSVAPGERAPFKIGVRDQPTIDHIEVSGKTFQ